MQQDPLGYAAGDSNLYGGEANDPINAADPLGLEAQWHHLLPQAVFTQRFLNDWKITDLDINSKQFGWILDSQYHTGAGGLHAEKWNEAWKTWVQRQENISRESIIEQLNKMVRDPRYQDLVRRGRQATMSYKEWKALDTAGKAKFLPKGLLRKVPFFKLLATGGICVTFVEVANAQGIPAAVAETASDIAAPVAKEAMNQMLNKANIPQGPSILSRVTTLFKDVRDTFMAPIRKLEDALK
jgi:hypothetical protein